MKEMIRIKTEEVAKLMELRGYRSIAALARAAGMTRQHAHLVLRKQDASTATLGTMNKFLNALSVPGEPIKIEDIVEFIPDEEQ